ncbi:MAG: N-6 DNA methylase [Alphaproteobacteria bacterium]|nr:N-6 DNA methylase [Alphaproteobacteria bacterium]
MAGTNAKLSAAVEAYFTDLGRVRASGGATGERSSYGPLAGLLNAVGAALKPKVFCVGELADQGAGHPDFGLYAAKQVQRGQPREGQIPERGVVEVKAADDDAWLTAASDQVSRYWERYRLVLVTNTRDFVLVGEDAVGRPAKLETFRLADNADDFGRKLEKPRVFASAAGAGLGEYLARALTHRAALAEPKDLAWLLASYARDGLARVEAAGDAPALATVRTALEDALGVRFEGGKGARFFHSTLVQTLFYGVFSAWVLWARQSPPPDGGFDWRTAVWHLRAPVLAALFQQLTQPGRLQPLGLIEVLDWTAAALDRVDRETFFSRFNEGEAVPYFYEPFLEAFDPELRKQLGVWYTPAEVVRYMVARVDRALKDDLSIPEGLAAENVYVLDPCCGTGAYLAEVLRCIAANLEGQGLGALAGARVKQAATERVFGFEIMPAPFVVAHLQVGLTMQELDAPLADDESERAQVFLTNALTGWEPTDREKQVVAFPELEEERDRAERVKRDTPILVILGNPPYNGFAGMAVDEERELSEAYRTTKRVRRPEGQGLNDLYVRFFRMAERRIAEKTGCGVVCFISNYSWLDGLSFTGMRERYLEAFDAIRIDCLNGDKYRTGKVAPDGTPDPSIFSTESDPVGIQVGTAITTLVRKAAHKPAERVAFRHLWGRAKRAELAATAETAPGALYEDIVPDLPLGLPFAQTTVSVGWSDWPTLPELFPVSFPGVNTGRNGFLIDIDLDRLKARIVDYFDAALSHEDIARRYPAAMRETARFDARAVRETLLKRGGPDEAGFVRHAYRPFDDRWLYWERDTKLLDEKRAEYRRNVFKGNKWLSAAQHLRREAAEPQACVTAHMGSMHLIERGAAMFPAWLRDDDLGGNGNGTSRANLTEAAHCYLKRLGLGVEDMFHHVLATLHDPAYRDANAGGLRMEWPRVPLLDWPEGNAEGAAEELAKSAERGSELAALLDTEAPVSGVTQGPLLPEIAAVAVPTTASNRNMTGDDFAVTAGWGRYGQGDAVNPGRGRAVERPYTAEERAAMGDALPTPGDTTFDIYLNGDAFWRNVPELVWNYSLGGYQVLKKWLSYRERNILGRPLRIDEVQYFADTARRISAILLLARNGIGQSSLDES